MEEHFFKRFQNKESQGSYLYAKEIAEMIKEILTYKLEDFKGIEELLGTLQKLRSAITPYKPTEFSIGNVIKRITSVIREQARLQGLSIAEEVENEKQENKFISRLFSFRAIHRPEEEAPASPLNQTALMRFKMEVMEAVDGIIGEFDNLSGTINESAYNHINNNEIIIVFGSSYTIASLLIEARKKKYILYIYPYLTYLRTFEVIVVENNLSKNGHDMAKKLADAQIKTTLIPDTAVYAVMHRVHKAFISAHSIMANGGILGTSGTLLVALACKAHLVPMIVVGGIYKLTPKIPFEQDTYNDLINPGAVFKADAEEKMENIDVIVPGFDYIAPEYVTLYITNLGEHTPAYIYRVFSEYYVNQ